MTTTAAAEPMKFELDYNILPEDNMEVMFGDKRFVVNEWIPGMNVPYQNARAIAADTECLPIIEGAPLVPALLQVAATDSDQVLFVKPIHFQAMLDELNRCNPTAQWVFFNGPFDAKMLGWPGDPLWSIFNAGRFVDLEMRGTLTQLANGTYVGRFSLDVFAVAFLGVKLDKDAAVRLSFAPGITLNKRQVGYAAQDAIATMLGWEEMPLSLATEDMNVKGYFALSSISDLGICVDEEYRSKLNAKMLDEMISQRNVLKLFGIAPALAELEEASVPGISKRKQELLHAIEVQYEVKLKKSKKSGDIAAEKKALDLQLIVNEIPTPIWLESQRKFSHAQKMRSVYLPSGMEGADGRVHAVFRPMVKTGRTSASHPPLQQYPRKGGIRGVWVPTADHLFLASDYNQLELCALAQSCYNRLGKSVMGDLINSDVDVHLWFGCILGGHRGLEFDPENKDHPVTSWLRDCAKAANFGIPGGLGAATFVAFAQGYGIQLSLDEAKDLIELWLETFPEMRDHFKHDEDDYWTSRNIKMYLRSQGMEAPGVRSTWDLKDFLEGQGWSEERARRATSNLTVYMVRTLTGRVKRNCTYCSAANLEFQGPAADGAKLALWEGYLRGWRMVNFIHDEILQEILASMGLEERTRFALEVERVMVDSMEKVLPRMKIKVESALMGDRWYKEAKPKHDDDGNLLIWMPESEDLAGQLNKSVA